MTTDELKNRQDRLRAGRRHAEIEVDRTDHVQPRGILFVADSANATIYAIDLRDTEAPSRSQPVEVDNLDVRLAAYMACTRDDILIRDMSVG